VSLIGPLLTVSPKREPAAWVRLAWDFTPWLFLPCFWVVNCMLGLVYSILSMKCMIMLMRLDYMGWNVELTWVWHELSMRWLVIKVAWYWDEMKFYIHGLGRRSWYGFNIDYEWGLVIKVDMRFMCLINITWLIEYDWSVVRNSMSLEVIPYGGALVVGT